MSEDRGLGEFSWQPHMLPGEGVCSAICLPGDKCHCSNGCSKGVRLLCVQAVADSSAGRFFTSGYFLYIRPLPSFTGVNQPTCLHET